MRKLAVANKINFMLAILITFLISYILQINLIVALAIVSLGMFLKFSHPALSTKTYKMLNLTLLFVIILVLSYFINSQGWLVFYIPFSLIPMLSIILFDNLEITLLLTLASSIAVTAISGYNYFLVILFMISGIIACLLAKDARRRMVVIRSGFAIGLVQALALFLFRHFKVLNGFDYWLLLINGIISSIIVIGTLPIFEYLFRLATNISLLELADLNNPLLQRLIFEAPGTYHHSLIVGNLSEAACKVIGAKALLARIGAYYHDIGKLSQPEYFSENQLLNESKHQNLSAALSKLIIINHVKEGVELAKKYKLNPSLVDFIQQHHGTSLVFYFYRRALENLELDQQIEEEGFRYPGPKPKTKETAIVLLADSVEAAARTLKEPTSVKIEELVHKINNNKFIDGQLDECDLTLKDLEKISAVFIRILTGIYHGRITYPEQSSS